MVWACIGPWGETRTLNVGDMAFKRPLESVWAEDFVAIVGKAPPPLSIANTDQVLEAVVDLLDRELARRADPRRSELVRQTALNLAWLTADQGIRVYTNPQGAWRFRCDRFSEPKPASTAAPEVLEPVKLTQVQDLSALLRELPEEFRFYIRSLTLKRADAMALCETVLHLPPEQRRNLAALAAYRQARLRMGVQSDVDEDGSTAQLQDVRRDLARVQALVAEGSPDIAHVALAAEGWLAHTHLYGRSTTADYDPADKEADAEKALQAYVRLWRAGDASAKNSIEQALRAVLESGELKPLARDPVLRRLTTAFLCSTRLLGDNIGREHAVKLNETSAHWLAALRAAQVDPGEDAVRLAALQYRVGQWDACAATLRSAPAEDATARLLQARLRLRAGDLAGAEALLRPLAARPQPVRPPETEEKGDLAGPPYYTFHALVSDYDEGETFISPAEGYVSQSYLTREHDGYVVDFTQQVGAASRARAELAVIELHHGRYVQAMNLFYRERLIKDGDYVAECVLTTAELKAAVDAAWPASLAAGKPVSVHDYSQDTPTHVRALLGRRLFREGLWEEAIPYLGADHGKSLRQFIDWMRVAQDPNRSARARADAYWRAALNVRTSGEEYLFCTYGLEWTSYDDRHWFDPSGLPRARIRPIVDEPENLWAPPRADEVARVDSWIASNLGRSARAYRDARYEFYRLALEAVAQLPDDDLAGAEILQAAGNSLKYREPAAAQSAYRQLATRFRGTPLGAAARKARWFSTYAVEPDPEWVAKLSKLK